MKACWLALLVCATGCTSPDFRYYGLPPVDGTPVVFNGMVSLRRVTLAAELDRSAIVQQGPEPQLVVSPNDRWAAPLDRLITETLAEDLRQRLAGSRVVSDDDGEAVHPALTIALSILTLNDTASGQLHLRAQYAVFAPGQQPRPMVTDATVTMAGTGSGGYAVSVSQALGRVADAITEAATKQK